MVYSPSLSLAVLVEVSLSLRNLVSLDAAEFDVTRQSPHLGTTHCVQQLILCVTLPLVLKRPAALILLALLIVDDIGHLILDAADQRCRPKDLRSLGNCFFGKEASAIAIDS